MDNPNGTEDKFDPNAGLFVVQITYNPVNKQVSCSTGPMTIWL